MNPQHDSEGDEQRPDAGPGAPQPGADRPRPEYGEYATPQEQAAAIAARLPRQKHPVPAPEPPVPGSAAPPAPRDTASGSAGSATADRSASAAPLANSRQGGIANRLATLMLLAIGLVSFMQTFESYRELPRTLQAVYDQAGLGEYTMIELATALGIVAIVVQAILWIIATVWSFNRLKAGRSSWWIALGGLVATFLSVLVIMAIAMLVDPAFLAYVGRA